MSDKGFRVWMAITAAVLFVVMSTPLSATALHDVASRLIRQISTSQAPAPVAVARK